MPQHHVLVRAVAGPLSFDTTVVIDQADGAGEALVKALERSVEQARLHLGTPLDHVADLVEDPTRITFPGDEGEGDANAR